MTSPRRGSVTLHPRADIIVSTDWVRAHLEDPRIAVVDARDTPFFLGTFASRQPQRRHGHIPGAYSIPFGTVVDEQGKLLSLPQLTALFRSVRAEPGDTVVTYCHVGQQGRSFGSRRGWPATRRGLYDDSFNEWIKQAQNPVERP